MDFINQLIEWTQQNWGVTVFGGLTLGGIITMTVLLVKQWVANKLQGSKYEAMWGSAMKMVDDLMELLSKEKQANEEKEATIAFMESSQAVTMDAIIKLALSSKLDSTDKAMIVANLERLKHQAPQTLIEDAKEKTNTIVHNVSKEVQDNPAQTVVNVATSASSLLDKYTTKEG